jgi:hypothetical protein
LDIDIGRRQELYEDGYGTSIYKLLSVFVCEVLVVKTPNSRKNCSPECVIFNSAPVAFLCTLISFDFASLVSGPNAPDLAIFALLSSWVAKLVMHPTALHCTSTFGDIIWRMRGCRPPRRTIAVLFSATRLSSCPNDVPSLQKNHLLFTARFPSAALAARCTSISGLCNRNRMGSRVSRPTSRTSLRSLVSIP